MAAFKARERKKLQKHLRDVFPDSEGTEEQAEALAMAAALLGHDTCAEVDLAPHRQRLEQQAAALGLTRTAEGSVLAKAKGRESRGVRYYTVDATHHRMSDDLEPFTGHLQMARVSLPVTKPATFKTRIGQLAPSDHLVATVAEVRAKYGGVLGDIARVDLITPARLVGTRFGAISVLLGYRKADTTTPSFYLLEAGVATGAPKVVYLVSSIDSVLNAFTGYRPTPFTNASHIYTAKLSLDGDSPDRLKISAHKSVADLPYMKLDVRFTETSKPPVIWPGLNIARAVAIVLSRRAMGVK